MFAFFSDLEEWSVSRHHHHYIALLKPNTKWNTQHNKIAFQSIIYNENQINKQNSIGSVMCECICVNGMELLLSGRWTKDHYKKNKWKKKEEHKFHDKTEIWNGEIWRDWWQNVLMIDNKLNECMQYIRLCAVCAVYSIYIYGFFVKWNVCVCKDIRSAIVFDDTQCMSSSLRMCMRYMRAPTVVLRHTGAHSYIYVCVWHVCDWIWACVCVGVNFDRPQQWVMMFRLNYDTAWYTQRPTEWPEYTSYVAGQCVFVSFASWRGTYGICMYWSVSDGRRLANPQVYESIGDERCRVCQRGGHEYTEWKTSLGGNIWFDFQTKT